MKESRVLEILEAVCIFAPATNENVSIVGPGPIRLAFSEKVLRLSLLICFFEKKHINDFFVLQIDSNTDGLVDFTEFVAATLHVHQLEEHNSEKWQQLSQAAFEKFDVDKDGYITPEELKMVCHFFFNFFFIFMFYIYTHHNYFLLHLETIFLIKIFSCY